MGSWMATVGFMSRSSDVAGSGGAVDPPGPAHDQAEPLAESVAEPTPGYDHPHGLDCDCRFPAQHAEYVAPWDGLNPPYRTLVVDPPWLYKPTGNFDVAKAWGFRYSQTLTWCKVPMGRGLGGAFVNTTEFVLFCRRGRLAHQERVDTTWWQWKRAGHSVKPQGFMDVVEQVSPGPYVELFARAPRLGWDAWGYGYEAAS